MKRVNFKVSPKGGTQTYAIWVDGDPVRLVNRTGIKMLEENQGHVLQYYMRGNSGGKMAIEGKDTSGATIVEVKEATIPTGSTRHAHSISFEM